MPVYIIIMLILGIPALYGISEIIKGNRKKRKQQSLALAYDKLVFEHKLSVEYIDILEDKVIAIDRKNKKLLLINHAKGTRQELCIPILQIAACRIIEKRDEQDRCIDRIELGLMLKRNFIRHQFCFYKLGKDPVTELTSLSRKAMHWNNRINMHIHLGSVNIEKQYPGKEEKIV